MNKKTKLLLYISSIFCFVSVLFMLVVFGVDRKTIKGEFVAPSFEENSIIGVPVVEKRLDWFTTNEDGSDIKISVCRASSIKDLKSDIYFTNHEENEEWMKLRIIDNQGDILAETGILKPGEYVKEIEFNKKPRDGQVLTYKIMTYEAETYYSAGTFSFEITAKIDK